MKKMFDIVKEEIGSEEIFDDVTTIEIDGVTYTLSLIDEEDTIDDGKYQFGARVYSVNHSMGGDMFYVRQSFSQSGSYFSRQERIFDELELVEQATKTITYWRSI